MKSRVAKPDPNSGQVLRLIVRTRDPLEAWNMLLAGSPIDVSAGYYEREGILQKDFYMMDNVDKLHALAAYREIMVNRKQEYDRIIAEQKKIEEDLIAKQNVTNNLNNNEAGKSNQNNGGTVSKPSEVSQGGN